MVGSHSALDGGGAFGISAVRWTPAGEAQDLGLEGTSIANDVNARGTIVGTVSSFALGSTRGFVLEPGGEPQLLASPAGVVGPFNEALGLNDRGDIVGQAFDEASQTTKAVLWTGRRHTPSVIPGHLVDEYQALDINDRGTIVGWGLELGVGRQAVVWVGPRHREVAVGPAGLDAKGLAINERDQVAGVRGATDEAFRWDRWTGRTTILAGIGDSDEARAIDDRGTVVGLSWPAGGGPRAVIFGSG